MTFKYCVKAFKRNPIMMLSLEWLVFIIVLIFQIIVTKLKLNITYVQCINLTKFFMKKEEYYYFGCYFYYFYFVINFIYC